MNIKNTEVFNFECALRGMRNPLESWDKSDSKYCLPNECTLCKKCGCNDNDEIDWTPYQICNNDIDLAQRLINGGTEHRKFLRQIIVCADIIAPIYWWKEFDTYKIGTTANSTSTMHKLTSTPITKDCFEMNDYNSDLLVYQREPYDFDQYMDEIADDIINHCENLRKWYLETKDLRYWKELIRWLPEGWLQTRTVTMNYENLRNMYFQRLNHKLSEWHYFCNWIRKLPYAEKLICYKNEVKSNV